MTWNLVMWLLGHLLWGSKSLLYLLVWLFFFLMTFWKVDFCCTRPIFPASAKQNLCEHNWLFFSITSSNFLHLPVFALWIRYSLKIVSFFIYIRWILCRLISSCGFSDLLTYPISVTSVPLSSDNYLPCTYSIYDAILIKRYASTKW